MRAKGFTIIELLMTLAIIALVVVFGLPALDGAVARGGFTANVNEVIGGLNLARLEAVKQGRPIRISSISGTADWSDGYRVWRDQDANNAFDAGEEIRVYEAMPNTLTLTGTAPELIFLASGFTSQATGLSSTFTFCSSENTVTDRQVQVNAAGRITLQDAPAC